MPGENKPTLRSLCRDRINDAVQDAFFNVLKAFHKTGDDLYLPKDFDEAINNLAEDLEFMLLHNPKED